MVANGLILTVAVVATAWNKATARGGNSADRLTKPLVKVRRLSLALLIASLIWVGAADAEYPGSPTPFPGLASAIYVLLGVQVVLLIAVFVFTAVSLRAADAARTAAEGDAPTLGGFTAPFVALIAWLLGSGFSVGVGLWAAQCSAGGGHHLGRQRRNRSGKVTSRALASFEEKVAALNTEPRWSCPRPICGGPWRSSSIAVAILAGLCVWWWTMRTRTKYELDSGDNPARCSPTIPGTRS